MTGFRRFLAAGDPAGILPLALSVTAFGASRSIPLVIGTTVATLSGLLVRRMLSRHKRVGVATVGRRRGRRDLVTVAARLAARELAAVEALFALGDAWPGGRQRCADLLCDYLRAEMPDGSTGRTLQEQGFEGLARRLHTRAPVRWHGVDLNLSGARIPGTTFTGCAFSQGRITLRGASFTGGRASFLGAEFAGGTVDFSHTHLADDTIDFTGARFSGAHLDFSHCDLRQVTLDFSISLLTAGTITFAESSLTDSRLVFYAARCVGGRISLVSADLDSTDLRFICALVSRAEIDLSGARIRDGHIEFSESQLTAGAIDLSEATFVHGSVDGAKRCTALHREQAPTVILLPNAYPTRRRGRSRKQHAAASQSRPEPRR